MTPEETPLQYAERRLLEMQPPWVTKMDGEGPFHPDVLETGPVPARVVKASLNIPPKAAIGNNGLGGDGGGGGSIIIAAAIQLSTGVFEAGTVQVSGSRLT